MKINTTVKILLGSILSALGYGCDEKIPEAMCMYGVPTATYKVKGTVTDSESRPIKNIMVKAGLDYGGEQFYALDSARTDANGKVEFTIRDMPADNCLVSFEDTDGNLNGGSFESKAISVTPVQTEKGDGSWNVGSYEVKFEESLDKQSGSN